MTEHLKAFAVGCHPDDIEFMMSGTLMLLKDAGYEIHYMNIANGSCGTACYETETAIKIRREESIKATELIGAVYHESLVNDLEVFYEKKLLAKMGSIIREVAPEIILTHSPSEYMEDHSNTCRLTVSAAFCRGMRNFPVTPHKNPVSQPVTIYHALPYGLKDPLNNDVDAGFYIDVESKIELKKEMLGLHKSQKEWLDKSQGVNAYIKTLEEMSLKIGEKSERFKYAEGWTRHLTLGFCADDVDPLASLI
ncbi:MAG: PIG-L family deacetylase [Verrucomicrobiota bacterium]|nr:PIG-L family deacetylase [Verrucomicrobiota bacterium]